MIDDATRTRFWAKVDSSGGKNACWPWMAGKSPKGYGKFWFRGTEIGAHRMVLLLTHGAIADGNVGMHKCDNPPCCNPAHIVEATTSENTLDKFTKGRGPRQRDPLDVAGRTFGRWTLRAFVEYNARGGERWTAVCACGAESVVFARNVISGKSTSCGCFRRERAVDMCTILGRPDQR